MNPNDIKVPRPRRMTQPRFVTRQWRINKLIRLQDKVIRESIGRRYCYICGHELIWQNDYDASGVYGWEDEDDGAIVSIWTCSHCGREYTISDPDKETRIMNYNDYWKEDTD